MVRVDVIRASAFKSGYAWPRVDAASKGFIQTFEKKCLTIKIKKSNHFSPIDFTLIKITAFTVHKSCLINQWSGHLS